MVTVRYNKQNLIAALEPGICALVVDSFEKKLADKLDGIVEEVYAELKKELPDKIKASVTRCLMPEDNMENFHVEVDLNG